MTAHSYSRLFFMVAIAVMGPLMSNPAVARGEFCGEVPKAGFDQPPNQLRSGHYVNPLYGYSVVIPSELNGYASMSGSERGFGIVLSWTPRAFLGVDAAYDTFFDITAQGAHRSDLSAIRLHDKVIDDQVNSYMLAGKPGGRFVTQVQCGNDPRVFIHEDVIVFVNREVYRLNLQTVPERYAADVKVFNQILRSWHWEKLAPAAQ
jgi:hypothetical protein